MPNMYVKRVIYEHSHFSVEELIDGEIVIKISAMTISPNISTAGNDLLNKVYEIAQEVHKFTSEYIDPFAVKAKTTTND